MSDQKPTRFAPAITVVLSILTAIASGGWTAYTYWDRKQIDQRKSSRVFSRSLQSIDDVYSALRNIVHKTSAHRALLLRVQDSGDVPVPGKDLYSSIVYEVHDQTDDPYKENWRSQLIDAQYTSMLTQLARDGSIENVVADMDPGILKTVYKSKGTKRALLFSIHQEPAYFFYVSIVFRSETPQTILERDEIRSSINNLRNLFRTRRTHLQAFKQ